MRKTKNILLLLTAAALMSACAQVYEGKEKSTGQINELLTVTGDKTAWNGPVGDSILRFFAVVMTGLAQAEPRFDVLNVPVSSFNDMFRKHHNILIIEIGPNFERPFSETKKDLWAAPQRVIKVTAPDTASFMAEFDRKKTAFLSYFEANERERISRQYAKAMEPALSNKIEKKFGYQMDIPGGFSLARESADFIWFRHKMHQEKHDVEIGILVYAEDYEDTIAFDPRYIIRMRDIMTMQNVPGPSENSFMKVAAEFVQPESRRITDFQHG